MKKRSVEILQRLLKVPHRGLDLNRLMDDYHITEKTLRGDIQEIIDFTGAAPVQADSHTLRLKKGADLLKCPLSSRQNREKEKKGRDYQKMVSVLICLQQPRIP